MDAHQPERRDVVQHDIVERRGDVIRAPAAVWTVRAFNALQRRTIRCPASGRPMLDHVPE